MMSSGNDEMGERESPPLRIDPKCFQDALRTFFQPIKTDDPRLDFYTMYKREATEYDLDYVKKYDEDLNTTLIFAGLFSAVSSAFVIAISSNLQPDPNDQSAALLRAILLTLNHSAIPNETPTVPPIQEAPPVEIVSATSLLFASLLISLLAAFVAMLGKQWLNRYLRHAGGSTIERCGDRQLKCDGLEQWPFHIFIESLPVMLQVALLLLACGLCRYMFSINTAVAGVLITFTLLGVVFYVAVTVAGASSYNCPFQTPGSVPLRSLCATSWSRLAPAILPITNMLHTPGEIVPHYAFPIHLSSGSIRHHVDALSERIQQGIRRARLHLPWLGSNSLPNTHHPPLPIIRESAQLQTSQEVTHWLSPRELAVIQTTNVNDVRCVSWILRYITDPEALDATIRLAGTIRWFEDGVGTEPPYDIITSAFHACFDLNGEVYPGSRDRAYYSGRAMLWINALAACKSEEFARLFPLPTVKYTSSASNCDLRNLLGAIKETDRDRTWRLLDCDERNSPSHIQWTSNLLLHLSWAQAIPETHFLDCLGEFRDGVSAPLDAVLNYLLMCCNTFGSPVEERVLKVQDKSGRLEQVLDQMSKAIGPTLALDWSTCMSVMLSILKKLENRPWCVTQLVYGWCAMVLENRQPDIVDRKHDLFLCLEVGFRHLTPPELNRWMNHLTHTDHHQKLISVALASNNDESIADLLCAVTVIDGDHESLQRAYDLYARYIVGLRNTAAVRFSPRLRQHVIYFIKLVGYRRFEEVDAEGAVDLLNHLHVGIEDISAPYYWTILLEAIQSPEGVRRLAAHSWELLVELKMTFSWPPKDYIVALHPHITDNILSSQQWDKLECWVGVVWMSLPIPENTRESLERATVSLFRQRPKAVQKLTEWLERYRIKSQEKDVPESFREIRKQMHEAQRSPLSSSEVDGKSPRSPPSARSLQPGRDGFWELLPLI